MYWLASPWGTCSSSLCFGLRCKMCASNVTRRYAQDRVTWKLTASGDYDSASAYRAQFLGSVKFDLRWLIWKPWAPTKCKFFAWLIIRNRVWTADRFATLNLPRNEVCPLCRSRPESAHHILVACRYSKRLWGLVDVWASIPQADPSRWPVTGTVRDWWLSMGTLEGVPGRGFRSLLLLVNWELWLERIARTFKRAERPVHILLFKIKEEARTWGFAGAKHLSALLEGV